MVAKTLSSINKIILSLYNDGNINKSALANLRASNSINSKHMTEVWPIFFKYIAKEDLSQNYNPSYTEIVLQFISKVALNALMENHMEIMQKD